MHIDSCSDSSPTASANSNENSANITVTFGAADDTISASIGQTAVIELTGMRDTFPVGGTPTDVQQNTVINNDGGGTNLDCLGQACRDSLS